MRKLLLIVGLLAAFSFTAAAENIVSLQGSYVNLGRGHEARIGDAKMEATTAIAALGATVSGYFGVSDSVGVLAGLGVYFPTNYDLKVKSGGRTQSDDADVKGLTVAGDLGVGWRLAAADTPLGVILGAGVRINHFTLNEVDDRELDDETGSTVLGIGARAMPTFAVSEAVYLVGSFSVGYDFVELSREPEYSDGEDYVGAFGVSFGLGVGFKL